MLGNLCGHEMKNQEDYVRDFLFQDRKSEEAEPSWWFTTLEWRLRMSFTCH